jgi:hypothetical protein
MAEETVSEGRCQDPNLGGPDQAVSQFRAGQGTSYGTGPRPLR